MLVGGRYVAPISIFRHSLVEFAACLVCYKKHCDEDAPVVEGCTLQVFEANVTAFIHEDYPELLNYFWRLGRHKYLYWTGPNIEVLHRRGSDSIFKSDDFHDMKLYEDSHADEALRDAELGAAEADAKADADH